MKPEEEIIKQAVTGHIVDLALDNNGTHVMQKILTVIKEENREDINNVLLSNFNKLVFDANGICVVNLALILA